MQVIAVSLPNSNPRTYDYDDYGARRPVQMKGRYVSMQNVYAWFSRFAGGFSKWPRPLSPRRTPDALDGIVGRNSSSRVQRWSTKRQLTRGPLFRCGVRCLRHEPY